MQRHLTALGVLLIAAPLLIGCSATGTAESSNESSDTSTSETGENRTAVVTFATGWAKAGTGMTGMFGTLTNHGETDLIISSLSSDAATHIEMHEVTSDGIMQAIPGDVVIPAGGTLELAPGATHIMLMQLTNELHAGDEISVQLTLSDGTTVPLTALVKNYSGANESYDDLALDAHTEHGVPSEHTEHTEHSEHAEHADDAGH